MPTIISTEILEIRYDKVFPAGIVTEFFELFHGDFHGLREGVHSGDHSEPSHRLVGEDGRIHAHYSNREEIEEYITRVLRGNVLSTA